VLMLLDHATRTVAQLGVDLAILIMCAMKIRKITQFAGKEVSDYADKESLRELIYDVATSQLDIQAH